MTRDSSLTGEAASCEVGGVEGADISLVRRAAQGDQHAFRALYEQHERAIFNLVYRLLRDREEAADLTQEVFVRAYRSLRHLRAPEAFSSWLRRIAVNLCQDHIKARRVPTVSLHLPATVDGDSAERDLPDESADVPTHVLEQELQQVVHRAVAALSVDHRTVVTLHHLQGMGVTEIADILGISVGTVKSRLSRARDELKRRLRPYVEEGVPVASAQPDETDALC